LLIDWPAGRLVGYVGGFRFECETKQGFHSSLRTRRLRRALLFPYSEKLALLCVLYMDGSGLCFFSLSFVNPLTRNAPSRLRA
jgi:hypothetical protein